MMRAVIAVLVLVLAGVTLMLAPMFVRLPYGLSDLMPGRPSETARERRPRGPQRVELVADGVDALILSRFVTGDVSRLLTGEALTREAQHLWFIDESTGGAQVGAIALSLMGMPPVTAIATGFRDGRPIRLHGCVTHQCRDWAPGDSRWGLGALRGQGAALGPEVVLEHLTFTDHDAYLAAHAEILENPRRWLERPEAVRPAPPPGDLQPMAVNLPTRLLPGSPPDGLPRADPALVQELEELAARLTEGLGGADFEVINAEPRPLWVLRDGRYLRGADGGTLALPDLVAHNPTLRLALPAEAEAELRRRIEAEALPPPDLNAVRQAIARAFDVWGLDGACLPDCADVPPPEGEWSMRAALRVADPPVWTLTYWDLPEAP